MGDLGVDTAVDGRRRPLHRRACRATGRSGDRTAATSLRSRCAPRARTRASIGPATLVGHFLGVADFDTDVDLEVTTLREAKRAESIRVSMTQRGQPIFDAMVWAVGDVSGLEHDVVRDARGSRSGVAAVGAGASGRAGRRADVQVLGELRRASRRPGSTTGRTGRRAAPVAGEWYRFVPRSTFDDPWLDACRSVILLDTLGWPAVCRLHVAASTSRRASTSRSRSIAASPSEPWLYAQAHGAERERRPRRVREPGLVAARRRSSPSAPANSCAAPAAASSTPPLSPVRCVANPHSVWADATHR